VACTASTFVALAVRMMALVVEDMALGVALEAGMALALAVGMALALAVGMASVVVLLEDMDSYHQMMHHQRMENLHQMRHHRQMEKDLQSFLPYHHRVMLVVACHRSHQWEHHKSQGHRNRSSVVRRNQLTLEEEMVTQRNLHQRHS
jgi:hypothetical protein